MNYDRFKEPGSFTYEHNDNYIECTIVVTDWAKLDELATGWTKTFWGPKHLDAPGFELERRAWFLKETARQVFYRSMHNEVSPADLSDTEGWLTSNENMGIGSIEVDEWPDFDHSDITLATL